MPMSKKSTEQKFPKEAVFAILVVVFAAIVVVSIIALELNKDIPDLPSLWQNIALSIMCSIVASIIFVLLQKAFTRNEHKELTQQLDIIEMALRRQNELYDSGIISLHPKSNFDKEDSFWRDIINNTEDKLDLIGHSLSKWFRPEYQLLFCNKIKSMVESDKEVNIVLSATTVSLHLVNLASQEIFDHRKLSKPEKTILQFFELMKLVDKEKRKNLKIYVADPSKVTYLYIRTDHQSIISPYIFSPSNNQNTFLLELQTGTKYAKTFEDDFRDMIEELDPLDLSPEEGMSLEQVDCRETKNHYSGNGWNFEKTKKYLYRDAEIELEAGYFEHYLDSQFIKSVIELPVSYGCPSKCKFCASSALRDFRPLRADQMMTLFEELYYTNPQVHENEITLVALTGIGDIFFNPDNVIEFLQKLAAYKNLQITLSSCLWNTALLERVDQLSTQLTIRNIQFTFISDKPDVLNAVIPISTSGIPNIKEIIHFMKNSDKQYYRINYVLIKDVNDSTEDFHHLRDLLADIKGKVVVRISKLNETKATHRNSLYPAEPGRAEELSRILSEAEIKNYIFCSETNDNMNCGQLLTERD